MREITAKKVNAAIHSEALEAFQMYIEERIEKNRDGLEGAKGDTVLALQGAISELRNLLKIRDYAVDVLKLKKG